MNFQDQPDETTPSGNVVTDLMVSPIYGATMMGSQTLRAAGALSGTPWLEKAADYTSNWANTGPLRPPAETQTWAHPFRKLAWGTGNVAAQAGFGLGLGPVRGALALTAPAIGSGIEEARVRLPNASKEDQIAAGVSSGLFQGAMEFTGLHIPTRYIRGGNVGKAAFSGAISEGPWEEGGGQLGNEAIMQSYGSEPTKPADLAKQVAEASLFGGIAGAGMGGGFASMHNRITANSSFEKGRAAMKEQLNVSDAQLDAIKPKVVKAWAEKLNNPDQLKKEIEGQKVIRGSAGGDFKVVSSSLDPNGKRVKKTDSVPYLFDTYSPEIHQGAHKVLHDSLDYVNEDGNLIAVVDKLQSNARVAHQFLLNDVAKDLSDGVQPEEIKHKLEHFKQKKNAIFLSVSPNSEVSLAIEAYHPVLSQKGNEIVGVPVGQVVEHIYNENVKAALSGQEMIDMSDFEVVGTKATEDASNRLRDAAIKQYENLVKKNPIPEPVQPVQTEQAQDVVADPMAGNVQSGVIEQPAQSDASRASELRQQLQVEETDSQVVARALDRYDEMANPERQASMTDWGGPTSAQPMDKFAKATASQNAEVAAEAARQLGEPMSYEERDRFFKGILAKMDLREKRRRMLWGTPDPAVKAPVDVVKAFKKRDRTDDVTGRTIQTSSAPDNPTMPVNVEANTPDWSDQYEVGDEVPGLVTQIQRTYQDIAIPVMDKDGNIVGFDINKGTKKPMTWKDKPTEKTVEHIVSTTLSVKEKAEVDKIMNKIASEFSDDSNYYEDPLVDGERDFKDSILTAMKASKTQEERDALENMMQGITATGDVRSAFSDLQKQYNEINRLMRGISTMLTSGKMIVSADVSDKAVADGLRVLNTVYTQQSDEIRAQLEDLKQWEDTLKKKTALENEEYIHWSKPQPPGGVTFVKPVKITATDINLESPSAGHVQRMVLSGPFRFHEVLTNGVVTDVELIDGKNVRISLKAWKMAVEEDAENVTFYGERPSIEMQDINPAYGGLSWWARNQRDSQGAPAPTSAETTKTIENDIAERNSTTVVLPKLKAKEFEAKPRSLSMQAMYFIMKKTGNGQRFLNAMSAWTGGETKFEETFNPTKIVDPTNELVSILINNKRLKTAGGFVADQINRVTNEVIEEEARAMLGGESNAGEVRRVMAVLKDVMIRSLEEFGINENGEQFVTTVGTQRDHDLTGNYYPPGESAGPGEMRSKENLADAKRKSYVASMSRIYEALGLEIKPEYVRSWEKTRGEQAYFNLLKVITKTDRLQRLVTWYQSEAINPAFEEMCVAGVLRNNDVVSMQRHGYAPRRAIKAGDQRTSGDVVSADPTASKSMPHAEYDTFDEFEFATKADTGAGMYALNDIVEAGKDYMIESVMKAAQGRLINTIKSTVMPTNGLFIKGFDGTDALSKKVQAVVRTARWVEYASKRTNPVVGETETWDMSETISELRKLTGLSPQDILTQLGYIQDHNREGLVAWDGLNFQPPWLQKGLSDLLDYVYPTSSVRLTNAAKVLNLPKRVLSIVPWDSIGLFSGGIIANTSPWDMPGLLFRYGKETLSSWKTGAATVAAMKRGEGYDIGRIQLPDMADYVDAVKMGFPESFATMVSGYLEDNKMMRWTSAIEQTPEQAAQSLADTTANINKHMFERFILKELWDVTRKKRDAFFQKDPEAGKEVALRRAVEYIAKVSFMTPSHEFGPSGQIYNIALFSRGLTFGPLALAAGAMGIGGKYKRGAAASAINPLSNAFTNVNDVKFLQRQYLNHIAKMAAIKIMAIGILQYALSFLDDKEDDDEKKRYFWNNPAGLTFATRLPTRDLSGNELYSKPQFGREINQWVDMAGWGSLPFPNSLQSWLKNRTNAGVSVLISAINNYDMGKGQKIADPKLPPDQYWAEMAGWMTKNMVPLSMGLSDQEKRERTGDATIDAALGVTNIFGANITSGPAGFFRPEQGDPSWNQLRGVKASKDLSAAKIRDAWKKMATEEIEPANRKENAMLRQLRKTRMDSQTRRTYRQLLKSARGEEE